MADLEGFTGELLLELVPVPISDIDAAIDFYVPRVGFSVEQHHVVDATHRFVELIPPGSQCSIALTSGYIDSQPGSLKGLQLNVRNVADVHTTLASRGVDVSDIEDHPWGRFCFFADPDGNTWSVHEPVG